MPIDEKYRPFATERQWECYAAVQEHGGVVAAAKALGVQHSAVSRRVREMKAKAAKAGYSPDHDMTRTVPDGYSVHGVSNYYTWKDEDGNTRGQWVKSRVDALKQQAAMQSAIEAACEDVPRVKPSKPPPPVQSELCNAYIITDYHLGMLSWHEETGDDWNLDIAERMLVDWFSASIAAAPPGQVAIFAQLGDFLHWDGMEAVTPASKHILDADTRFQKLVRVAIRVIRQILDMLLQKYPTVRVLMADANHDPASGVWLREMLAAMYENEPRIEVDQSADTYYCYEWGLTSLFFHHGHKKKLSQIVDVFVAKFREIFGRTKYSYAHTGHLHHKEVKETNQMTVEQHQTLAAKDAHASRGGWLADRSAQVITYHKRHGEVARLRITPEMLDAA